VLTVCTALVLTLIILVARGVFGQPSATTAIAPIWSARARLGRPRSQPQTMLTVLTQTPPSVSDSGGMWASSSAFLGLHIAPPGLRLPIATFGCGMPGEPQLASTCARTPLTSMTACHRPARTGQVCVMASDDADGADAKARNNHTVIRREP
jgi:hypothetical protein